MSFTRGSGPSYGLNQPYVFAGYKPIVSRRAPTVNDRANIGATWIDTVLADSYTLVGIANNQAVWLNTAGGAGIFATITVSGLATFNGSVNMAPTAAASTITLGNAAMTGTLTLGQSTTGQTINMGTGAAGVNTINIGGTGANVIAIGNTQTAGSVSVGAAMTTGTLSIGGTGAQTGTISIAPGTGAQQVLIADSNTGVKQVAIAAGSVANLVTIGSTTGAAQTTINSGSLSLDLTMAAPVAGAGGIKVTQGAVPFRILCGAGAPNNNLAVNVGDLYINSTGSGVADRMYICSVAGAWVNFTTSA
jgi:hypothetical protein